VYLLLLLLLLLLLFLLLFLTMGTTSSLLQNPQAHVSVDEVKQVFEAHLNKISQNGVVKTDTLLQSVRDAVPSVGKQTKDKPKIQKLVSFTGREIKDIFARHGLLPEDPRLADIVKQLIDHDGQIAAEDFEHIRKQSVLVNRAMSGELIVPDFEELREDIYEIYEKVLPIKGGNNADYIPQLSEKHVNPDQWGVSVCTIDGQCMNIGDAHVRFGVQSCSKAISYCLAQTLHGAETVHKHVGMEPSGRPFNEMCLDYRKKEADLATKAQLPDSKAENFKVRPAIPHNPMINAGAIMIASMLFPDLVISDRFDAVMDIWQKLIGTSPEDGHAAKPSFANSMYLSEAATADRNRCLAYMMKEEKAFMESANLEEVGNLFSFFSYRFVHSTNDC
jgi:glutaminase